MKSTRRRALYVIAALLGALFILACLAGFAACGGGKEPEPEPEPTPTEATVSSVSISPSSLSLKMGATTTGTLTATVKMSDGTNSTAQTVNWTSSDTSVATVSATGYTAIVTALKDGTTNITASVGSVKSTACVVSVAKADVEPTPEPEPEATVESVSVSPETLSLKMDETTTGTVTATVTMSDNSNSDSQTVTWKSSDTSVATVSETGYTATVTAVGAGTTEITASVGAVTSTNKCTVTVEAATVEPEPEPEPAPEEPTEVGTADALVEALAEGGEIELAADITVSSTLEVTVDTELDLAGHALTGSGCDTITVSSGVNFTIDDSTGTGKVDATAHQKAALVNEGGTVTLDGGTFERSQEKGASESNNGGNSYYTVVNHGTMTVNDGVFILNAGDFSSNLENGYYSGGDETMSATLTINGGTICGGLYAVKNDSCGTLTVNGGTIGGARSESDTMPYRALLNWNVATLNGGKLLGGNSGESYVKDDGSTGYADGSVIYNTASDNSFECGELTIGDKEGKGPEIIYEVSSNDYKANTAGYADAIYLYGGDVTVQGGSIGFDIEEGEEAYCDCAGVWVIEGTLTVTGGTISGDEAIYVSSGDGSVLITGGTFKGTIENYLSAEDVVIVASDETMLDWAVALNTVTVALGADIAVSDTVTISTTVILDLNGHTLSCATDDTIKVTETGKLTVIDGSEEKTGTVDATANGKAALVNEGTVVLDGGTFERSAEASTSSSNNGGNSYYTVVNHGTMTINEGATIFNKGEYSSNLENGGSSSNAYLVINGGLIYGGLYAVKNDTNGYLVINGGTIGGARSESDAMPYRALLNWNEAYIYGGKLLGGNGNDSSEYDGCTIYNSANDENPSSVGKLIINGGEIWYEGQKNSTSGSGWGEVIYMNAGTVVINGGRVWGKEDNYEEGYGASGIGVDGGTLTVNGGVISGAASIEIWAGSVTINGGDIAEPVDLYTGDWGTGTLTFGEDVKGNFTVTMFDEDWEETEDENEAICIEYTQKSECELNGHVLTGTYDSTTASWTYVCDECGKTIELTTDTNEIASLTLIADDETSLRAAATWNDIEDMAITIHVVSTDSNNGTITITGTSNIGLRYGEKTIVLDADIDMGTSRTIIVLTTVVLDLNGHSISRTGDTSVTTGVVQVGQYHGGQQIYEYGDLTVKDSSTDQNGKISGSYGVVVVGGNNNDGLVSSFTLVSGTIDGSKIAISTNGSTEWGAEKITIQGGTVSGGAAGIYLPSGSLTVTGGEISGMTGIEIKAGYASITGGTISTTVEDGTTSINKNSEGTDTCGYAIAIINGNAIGSYKTLTSVSISDGVTLAGTVYVDASVDSFVTVCDGLDLAKDACDESGYVIADKTAEGVEVDHYIYREKTECEKNGHTATTYSDGNMYAVYKDLDEDGNCEWCAWCEVCNQWFEIGDEDIYDFVLVATTDEASLNAAIAVAKAREDGSADNRTQILVYGTITISDDSYVLIDCDNVEIYGLGAENSKIIDSTYESTHSGTAQDGVEITGKNVTIRDLTIDGSKLDENSEHKTYEHGLEILGSAENVTLSNCTIIGGTTKNSSAVVLMNGYETGYLLIENCTLSGYHGLTIEHDGSDLNVTISGGKIDGSYYGILIDAGSGVHLNVVNAEVYGKNSLTTNTTSAIFTNCTFGYNVYENKAYGSMGVYCDVTLKGCTFLANDTECSDAYDGLVNNSRNYVIQARTADITINLIDCEFVNTNEALEGVTLKVTEGNFIYIVGSKSTSCYLYFDDSEDAVKYAYDSNSYNITEYTGEEPGEGDGN